MQMSQKSNWNSSDSPEALRLIDCFIDCFSDCLNSVGGTSYSGLARLVLMPLEMSGSCLGLGS
jgi:hypothetical protein